MKKTIIIDGVETNYLISDDGRVYNKITERELKGYDGGDYKRVQLVINNKYKTLLVHRLVALMFVPNPNNYNIVDHINRNKFDNRAENLRWVTLPENAKNVPEKRVTYSNKKANFLEKEWKLTPVSENYIVSIDGEIANKNTLTILKGSIRGGYHRVQIDGKHYSVHRLVYEAFNGQIYGVIDHIDGNKLNNKLNNLRDVSQSINIEHSHKNSHKGNIGVTQYSISGEKLKYFQTLQEAANFYGVTQAAIKSASNYGTKSCNSYWLRDDSITSEKDFIEPISSNCSNYKNLETILISKNNNFYAKRGKHTIPKFKDENGIYCFFPNGKSSYSKVYIDNP